MALGAFHRGIAAGGDRIPARDRGDDRAVQGAAAGAVLRLRRRRARSVARAGLASGAVFGALSPSSLSLKALALYPLARLFGATRAPPRATLRLTLGPGGEFAFVLVGAAVASGARRRRGRPDRPGRRGAVDGDDPLRSVAGSAALTARRRALDIPARGRRAARGRRGPRVILVGFGRVGALIAEMLDVHDIPYLAVDSDANIVARRAARGQARLFRRRFARRSSCAIAASSPARALVVTMDAAARQCEDVVRARPHACGPT